MTDALICFGRMGLTPAYIEQITSIDGLDTVISAIDAHAGDKEILELGLAFLENVAMCGEDAIQLLQDSKKAQALFAKLLEEYENDPKIRLLKYKNHP